MNENKKKSIYDETSIEFLEGLDGIRKRPAMYIGSSDSKGLTHLIYEVIDNSIDENVEGYCHNIKVVVTTLKKNIIEIIDDGRGIPSDLHPLYKINTLDLVFEKIHSGGKFNNNVYKTSSGLHGVGLSVVNALSEELEVEVLRNSFRFFRIYKKGKKILSLNRIVTSEKNLKYKLLKNGTRIKFIPDSEIFLDSSILLENLTNRLTILSVLNKNLKIEFFYNKEFKIFENQSGIQSLFLKQEGGLLKKNWCFNTEIKYLDIKTKEPLVVLIEGIIKFDNDIQKSFVNNIDVEDGIHLKALYNSLIKFFNGHPQNNKLKINFNKEIFKEVLSFVISIKVSNPEFSGQTKNKFTNKELYYSFKIFFEYQIRNFFIKKEDFVSKVFQLLLSIHKNKKKLLELKLDFEIADDFIVPYKLSECLSQDVAKRELFLVEGRSAGGTAKQARNRNFQAVLALSGKIINSFKNSNKKVFLNKEIQDICKTIGLDFRKEKRNIEKLRYGKVIILCDADPDGYHIVTLLIGFFIKFFYELIGQFLYVSLPPRFCVSYKTKRSYFFTKNNAFLFLKENKIKKYTIQIFKGVGELNPDQLYEHSMDPNNRNLLKIILNKEQDIFLVLEMLLGQDILSRKQFIKNFFFPKILED